MLVVPKALANPWKQFEFTRANCAGQGCTERMQCRRYRVRLEPQHEAGWERAGTGEWISADLERKAKGGECPVFRKFIG